MMQGIMGKKWTAFLRLKGETWTMKRDEMLDEFDGLASSFRALTSNYNLIVFVEDEGSIVLPTQNSAQTSDTWVRRKESGA
jgi:hypothetical protein